MFISELREGARVEKCRKMENLHPTPGIGERHREMSTLLLMILMLGFQSWWFL